MKTRTRIFVVLAGISLVFVASLFLIAKPLSHLSIILPPVSFSHNVPYFLYLRTAQALFGYQASAVLIANGLLMMLTSWLVFRVGWSLADSRHRLLGATVAILLFVLNPMVIVLPLTLGFLGGYLLVPLILLAFFTTMLGIENWSAFMRAIVLALVWSLFLWVHFPTALLVLVAMIPWVFYSRRPMQSLGIFLTVLLFGTALFSIFWTIGCALARQWSLMQGPLDTMRSLGSYLQQEVMSPLPGGGAALMDDRLAYVAAWLSPFFLLLGLWTCGKWGLHILRERRASTVDLMALVSLIIFAVLLGRAGKDKLPGAWYVLMLIVLWCPLVAQSLSKKENLYSRGFRFTFLAGFLVCGAALLILQGAYKGRLLPDPSTLWKLVVALALAGGPSHMALKKHPLTLESRLQALLTGATLAYVLVIDGLLFQ